MAFNLNLAKAQEELTSTLVKAGLLSPPEVDVVIAMDVSGSFDDEHQAGITNDLMQRLIPWSVLFDPDKKIEFYTFSNGNRVSHRPDVTLDNYTNYIAKHVIDCPGYNGGTDYSPVLQTISKDFSGAAKSGLFGFGKKAATGTKPVLVFFITDGDNNDKAETRKVFQEMQSKSPNIYVQFLGVSSDSDADFPFIDALGEAYPNVGFTAIPYVKQWVQKTNDQVNEALISQELITWLKG